MRATVFRFIFRETDLLVLRLNPFFPTANCFQTVFVHPYFAIVLSFLRSLTTSSISGAAISIKSAPIIFSAGLFIFLIKGIAVLPSLLQKQRFQNFFHVVLHVLEK